MPDPSRSSRVAASLIALPLLLAGCSGSSGNATSSSTSRASTSAKSSAATTPSTSTTTTPSASPGTGASAGKPTKAEAAQGLLKILGPSGPKLGVPAAKIAPLSTCIVEKTYSSLSAKSLSAMASGDETTSPDKADQPKLAAALAFCGTTLGIGPSASPTSSPTP